MTEMYKRKSQNPTGAHLMKHHLVAQHAAVSLVLAVTAAATFSWGTLASLTFLGLFEALFYLWFLCVVLFEFYLLFLAVVLYFGYLKYVSVLEDLILIIQNYY